MRRKYISEFGHYIHWGSRRANRLLAGSIKSGDNSQLAYAKHTAILSYCLVHYIPSKSHL